MLFGAEFVCFEAFPNHLTFSLPLLNKGRWIKSWRGRTTLEDFNNVHKRRKKDE